MSSRDKVRLDVLLVEKGLAPTRNNAQALIMAGLVVVDDHGAEKPGMAVDPAAKLRIKGDFNPYVSRGGLKLEAALREFKVSPEGKCCLDVGASTGGFTDCLLINGARKVYAVDVGYGQLAWKLREDPKVFNLERCNIRTMPLELIEEAPDLIVVDASFISVTLFIPKIYELLKMAGEVIVLVKPQFEVEKGQVGKGGVVRDPDLRLKTLEKVCSAGILAGFKVCGTMESPVPGAKKGNIEYLVHFVKA